MPELRPAKLLRVYVAEGSRSGGRPLYEAIVEKCREMQVAGATVLRADEGFGGGPEIHRTRLLAHDRPLMVAIVDESEKIGRLVEALQPMLQAGTMAVSSVRMRRVEGPSG